MEASNRRGMGGEQWGVTAVVRLSILDGLGLKQDREARVGVKSGCPQTTAAKKPLL